MRLYLAYKYRAVPDKTRLQNDLISISDALTQAGHKVFLLGRDIQSWKYSSVPLAKTLPAILKNLIKSDRIVVFYESEVKSKGLFIETLLSKILNKPAILFQKQGVGFNLKINPEKTVVFDTIADLLDKIKNI